ncbi:hypothetical protein [Christiangramia sp.]|uniref:hypothetical protein n=1 Tax=Christiangramia sp. TaxID=1931228 RepID=UPI00263002C0|nr:hypothetical protein [Christiangramia sp.]
MDEALEAVGPDHDMLVDGVVRYTSYPFVSGVTVEGTAAGTRAMKARMGEAGFQEWLKGQDVLREETAVVIKE